MEDGIAPKYRIKPALRPDCIDVFDAFVVLGAARFWDQGCPQPLQVSEIDRYVTRMRITYGVDQWFRAVRQIQMLDEVERAHIMRKKASEKAETKPDEKAKPK